MPVSPELFVEQAEYLDKASFLKWGADHPDEDLILRRLMLGGAKLISGPRGCGKTTLMLKAYNLMLQPEEKALPVYVNFKRSLSIEPLYVAGDRGIHYFNQWILLKVYDGLYKAMVDLGIRESVSVSHADALERIAQLEQANSVRYESKDLTLHALELDLLRIVDKADRHRCVLLLDDAAHAFSAEQQRDFFDFFRAIKSREISPKAAIYPGVTTYSSSFHVGHDAEEIDVWVKPDRPGYLQFMKKVVDTRFPADVTGLLHKDQVSLDFLCYASFGIPRAFLNMLQALVLPKDATDSLPRITRRGVMASVRSHYQGALDLFSSLKKKVPIFENYIDNGSLVLSKAIDQVKEYNSSKAVKKQSVSLAIESVDYTQELVRLFGLFQYAGLCIHKGSVSRGEKGRFEIFVLHYAGLATANAILARKGLNIEAFVEAFGHRDAHEFTRVRAAKLLAGRKVTEVFALSLPPCGACGTPRVHKDARFCSSCGAKLTLSSTYRQLLDQEISALPLTKTRVDRILKGSSIRKVKDILLDHEHRELLKVKNVGPYWADKIVRLAEEFVE